MCISAYQITYGDALVWQPYRRNHKGSIPPEKTRKTCIVCRNKSCVTEQLFECCIISNLFVLFLVKNIYWVLG